MPSLTATIPAAPSAPADPPLDDEAQELMERLESLPVRLEPGVLAAVMTLYDREETTEQISDSVKLHPLIVTLEVRRELERREQTPALTAEEWNGLAAGTHVFSKQLRDMIDTAVRFRPGFSRTSVMRDAGIKDSCHGHRLLGYRPYPESNRPKQTITSEYAAGIAYALDRAPSDVMGL
jgi:hypothetical protein